jgi:hypothetical protein
MDNESSAWANYEQVSVYLLNRWANHFGLSGAEGKQHVAGVSTGSDWEIDGKAFKHDGDGYLLVECRRHTVSRLKKEEIAALAYRISDTGASGGIIISPLGLQEGAAKVAKAAGVLSITLRPDSTGTDYFLRFLHQAFVGVSDNGHGHDSVRVLKYDEHGTLIEDTGFRT